MTTPLVEIDDRSGFVLPEGDLADELARVMAAVLAAEGAGDGATAGLHLVSVAEITDLNEAHMGAVGSTDVLSFAVDGIAEPQGEGQPTLVGDVLLSPEVAANQADDHAGSVAAECRMLVVHGTLHLTGWDHDGEQTRADMWNRERELHQALEIMPPKDPWGDK